MVKATCTALSKRSRVRSQSLATMKSRVQVLSGGAGGITESDVILAHASGAAILGFNVRAKIRRAIAHGGDGVEIRYYNIIYNIVDDVKAALSGMLTPETREKFLGNAEILEVFTITKVGKVAGCRVTEGVVRRGARVRLIRDNVVVHEGELSTLKDSKTRFAKCRPVRNAGCHSRTIRTFKKATSSSAMRSSPSSVRCRRDCNQAELFIAHCS